MIGRQLALVNDSVILYNIKIEKTIFLFHLLLYGLIFFSQR